jgi:cell division transport system permease protein
MPDTTAPAPIGTAAAPRPLPHLSRIGRSVSLIPPGSIAARSLVTVVAIMTFLAALTAAGVQLVAAASSEWRSSIAREFTIQVKPRAGRDIEADLAALADLAGREVGVDTVRVFTRVESERLLEPWLGSGVQLDQVAVPRIIVVRLKQGAAVNLDVLRAALVARVPGATIDNHRLYIERLQTMASTIVVGGITIVLLVLAATALAVGFATQGAMAGNRAIVEILHLVGAEDRYIVREFARHFLRLGLQGGAIGGLAAILAVMLAGLISSRFVSAAGADQLESMFGSFSLGFYDYLTVGFVAALTAAVTTLVSTQTVSRQLRHMFMTV